MGPLQKTYGAVGQPANSSNDQAQKVEWRDIEYANTMSNVQVL